MQYDFPTVTHFSRMLEQMDVIHLTIRISFTKKDFNELLELAICIVGNFMLHHDIHKLFVSYCPTVLRRILVFWSISR